MLEAYLFVDPLCKKCLRSEEIVQKLARNVTDNLSYQFIPMLNIKIMNHSSPERIIHNVYYQMVLDYKAALFQGKKRGQSFFMMLQNELVNYNYHYNNHTVIAIAENAKLDLDMFKEDRRSKLAQKSFKSDQKLVYEMQIKKPASAVIYNFNSLNAGMLFNNINYKQLFRVCCPHYHHHKLQDQNGIPIPKLHL